MRRIAVLLVVISVLSAGLVYAVNRNFNPAGVPAFNSVGSSAVIRNEFAAVGTGFHGVEVELDAKKGNTAFAQFSTATQAKLNAKADNSVTVHTSGNETVAGNKTFTGTTAGITKSMVGLGNVDNTADINKPISTAMQAALDTKITASYRGALVYNCSTAGTGAIPWASEVYDTDNVHDNSTNNTRLTVPAGVSRIRISGQTYASASGVFATAVITKNGSAFPGQPKAQAYTASTSPIFHLSSAVLIVSPGDYFELETPTNRAADATGEFLWFSMEIVR